VGPLKAIVFVKAQGMCLLTLLGEVVLKYLKLKVIDLFFSERRKVINAIKSQFEKQDNQKINYKKILHY
jgi:hypothetical protein